MATASPPVAAATDADGDRYTPWLRLRLSHGFLTSPEGVGRVLTLQPCAATARAMARLELVGRWEGDGCVVLVKPRQRPRIASWLAGTGGGPLRWRLLARQGAIWGCTAVPMEARCRQWHLHGVTAAGPVDGPLETRLLTVVERHWSVLPPQTARWLRLLDGQGRLLREMAVSSSDRPLVVPLADLPEGLLQPSFGGRRKLDPFLHLAPEPNAIGLASLWLPSSAAAAGPLDFSWALPGRRTVWHYLLVPQRPGDALDDLRVTGEGCAFTPPTAWESLADGRRAWRLVGDRPLPLLDRGSWRFRLEGQRLDAQGQSHRLVIDPLPLAPSEPVWPDEGPDPLVGVSEIVVPI
jgi:hypothetical protein